tara:strand:- start:183 stop:404 length:222 start_codon:yes stop_codon:yes gene_type:complete
MKVLDYEILVKELVPPIGGKLTHYAVIQFLVVEDSEGNKRMEPGLGETHGKSEEEARSKMREKFKKWEEANCE